MDTYDHVGDLRDVQRGIPAPGCVLRRVDCTVLHGTCNAGCCDGRGWKRAGGRDSSSAGGWAGRVMGSYIHTRLAHLPDHGLERLVHDHRTEQWDVVHVHLDSD